MLLYALIRTGTWILAVVAGCCSSSEDPPGAEEHDEEFLRCAVLDASGSESFARGRYRYERDGHELDVQGPKDGLAKVGALAGLEDAGPASIASIVELAGRMRVAEVEAIVVAGGIGTDEASARAVLAPLARLDVPVLLVPGASEPIEAFRAALASAREKAPNLVDMGVVRVARLPDLTVVSLPGGPRAHELLAGEDGCGLTTEDVAEFGLLVRERPGALVVSATPPRQRGSAAIDIGRSGVGAGDPSVTRALAKTRFGVFGYVYESGGRAADRSGHRAVAEGAWSEELFLNVGAADALPRVSNDGALAAGMAALVEIRGRRARHSVLRTGD
ncbi:MAG: hypothetical protein HYY06_10885 [Deltaproteobacteria bacterium]|nr:hypothetical protein [Deltaproteobacteria bacterium]